MPCKREPRADREDHEADREEGEHDRTARESRERHPPPAQRVERQLRPCREPDERDRRFFNKPERIHFFALHEAEPRGADRETHEQVARETRQPHAPRDLPVDVRDEQKEAEHPPSRDEKAPSSGPARTDSPPSAWAAKYQSPCAFDNALERRYLPLAVWRSFTSTPIASTPSSTAPTGSPNCSTGSRRWAWTRSRSPTTATCTGRGSSTPRPGRARSGPSSASRRTLPSATATSVSAPLPRHRVRIPISCCSRGTAPDTRTSSSSPPSDSWRATTAGRASIGRCSSGTLKA